MAQVRWLLPALLLMAGCGGAPADPLERLLAEIEEAAEDRDAEAFGSHLAPGFVATGGMDRAATIAEVRRWLALYQGIDVTLSGIERVPPSTVRFRADFSGRPKDLPGLQGMLPGASAFRFELQTAPGPEGALQIAGAKWERMAMPGETAP
jgi:hypothetical protein